MRQRRTWLGWWCALVLAGCAGTVEDGPGRLRDPAAPGDAGEGSGSGGAAGTQAAGSGSGAGPAAGQGAGGAGGMAMGEPPAGVGTDIFGMCAGDEQPGPRLLRLMTRAEYANTVRDLLFVDAPQLSSLPLEARVRGYDNNAFSQAVTSRHLDAYMDLGEGLAEQAVQQSRGQLVPCDGASPDCPRQFVETFGRRAFRRPLTDEEIDRYVGFFAAELTEGDFDEGLRLAIRAMLVSPHFLYRSEVGTEQADGTYRLSPYEVASALSYLYWGSMPDDTLFEAAERDELRTEGQLQAQAERLLANPRAADQLFRFSTQWLRTDGVSSAFKDPEIFPAFNDHVREAMLEEQRRLFAKVVLEDEGRFADLFAPGYVLVNQALASYYGLPAPSQDFEPVSPEGTPRGGILGLGAVHAAHAHSNESSPIKRGLFVRDRLLCQTLPPPPENLDTTPPGLDPTLTTRERFARHTADPACSSCHKYIDGVGFGFEAFDGAGLWRETEHGLPIDTSGEVLGLEGLSQDTVEPFDGAAGLTELLKDSDTAESCLALQYYRFGRGYEERSSDACSLSALMSRFEAADLTVKDLLIALPQLRSFVIRAQ